MSYNNKIKRLLFLLCVIAVFPFVSGCSREKVLAPSAVRNEQDRAITIINQTKSRIAEYQVNTNGIEIIKGAPANDSFSVKIPNAYKNDQSIEVVLTDQFGRIYANTVDVPADGNTDIVITKDHRVSEGFFTDRWDDIEAFFNKNK
jgi:hypothetical protein